MHDFQNRFPLLGDMFWNFAAVLSELEEAIYPFVFIISERSSTRIRYNPVRGGSDRVHMLIAEPQGAPAA